MDWNPTAPARRIKKVDVQVCLKFASEHLNDSGLSESEVVRLKLSSLASAWLANVWILSMTWRIPPHSQARRWKHHALGLDKFISLSGQWPYTPRWKPFLSQKHWRCVLNGSSNMTMSNKEYLRSISRSWNDLKKSVEGAEALSFQVAAKTYTIFVQDFESF